MKSLLAKNDPKFSETVAGRAIVAAIVSGPPAIYADRLNAVDDEFDIEPGAAWEILCQRAAVEGGIRFDTTDPETGEEDPDAIYDATDAVMLEGGFDEEAMTTMLMHAHTIIDFAYKEQLS